MPKLLTPLCAGLLLVALAPAANAQERDYVAYDYGSGYGYSYDYGPPYRGYSSTENENGSCVVNDGTSQQRLDLDRRCDRREFWRRMDKH
ncbi:MAG: hypothetical protein JSS20_03375 [Proteobacteria bacterium]|nr:hypothetical protein [Pseudomonadota bacterium]